MTTITTTTITFITERASASADVQCVNWPDVAMQHLASERVQCRSQGWQLNARAFEHTKTLLQAPEASLTDPLPCLRQRQPRSPEDDKCLDSSKADNCPGRRAQRTAAIAPEQIGDVRDARKLKLPSQPCNVCVSAKIASDGIPEIRLRPEHRVRLSLGFKGVAALL